jgi:hypothetical protein
VRTLARLLVPIAVGVLLATACSSGGGAADGGGGGNNPGSCNAGKNSCSPGTTFCCADYRGNFTAASVQNDCSIAMGTYSPAVCTTANREGSCTLYAGTAAEKTIRYYTGYDALSKSDPVTNCAALHGTYAPN